MTAPSSITVHTLDARGHLLLEVMRDYLQLSPQRMNSEIQSMIGTLIRMLADKGIDYADLKSALTPRPKRSEVALIFDTLKIKSNWYGREVHRQLLPLFDRRSSHSIKCGDYQGENDDQKQRHADLIENLVAARPVEYRHSSQFYVVYINNLSSAMIDAFNHGLKPFDGYVGYIDTSFSSAFKILASTMLVSVYIKHRDTIICGHESDRDETENVNLSGFPFEDSGYKVRSFNSDYEGVFLSYKIERPVFPGFEADTEFALSAISAEPLRLSELEVQIETAKFEYLANAKEGSIKRLGLLDSGAARLKELIQAKLSSNYIYNMSYEPSHQTAKFNIMIELGAEDLGNRFRVLVAMEYLSGKKALRLITLH